MPVPISGYPYEYNEFVIKAGVPQTVAGSTYSGERHQHRSANGAIHTNYIYCTKSVYFTPKPGHMYDFIVHPGGRDNCYVEITDITVDVNNPEKVDAQPTDFCKDDED